jgi:ferredoxin
MGKNGLEIIMKHCKQCGACAIECPDGAMTIAKEDTVSWWAGILGDGSISEKNFSKLVMMKW